MLKIKYGRYVYFTLFDFKLKHNLLGNCKIQEEPKVCLQSIHILFICKW